MIHLSNIDKYFETPLIYKGAKIRDRQAMVS